MLPGPPPLTLVGTPRSSLAGELAQRLADHGCDASLAFTLQQVRRIAGADAPLSAVVLDAAFLEGTTGDLVAELRRLSGSPVVVMDADVLALVGAVEAVIAALLPSAMPVPTPVLAWEGIELEPRTHQAWLDGHVLGLTPIEFRILTVLLSAGGGLVRKAELEKEVWGTQLVDDGERLATHVRRIRAKVESDARLPSLVLTVRGLGYRMGSVEGRRTLSISI